LDLQLANVRRHADQLRYVGKVIAVLTCLPINERFSQKFDDPQFPGWTLTHAFFADMGGFVLEASDLKSPLPLDAEQVFYLVKEKYINYPTIPKEEIDDKNKADGLAR
jgi:hypothetical protein